MGDLESNEMCRQWALCLIFRDICGALNYWLCLCVITALLSPIPI